MLNYRTMRSRSVLLCVIFCTGLMAQNSVLHTWGVKNQTSLAAHPQEAGGVLAATANSLYHYDLTILFVNIHNTSKWDFPCLPDNCTHCCAIRHLAYHRRYNSKLCWDSRFDKSLPHHQRLSSCCCPCRLWAELCSCYRPSRHVALYSVQLGISYWISIWLIWLT